jgi:hypothetical protein
MECEICKALGKTVFNENTGLELCQNCINAINVLSSTIVYKHQLKGLIELGWSYNNSEEIKHLKNKIQELNTELIITRGAK